MTSKLGLRRPRPAFTMIEVLTVAAIAVIIMGLTIPAYGWMTESREREKVSETIAAQVMGARALAVQYRTYAGVMVRCTGASTQCASTRSGTIRMIQVNPRDVNDPVWNKSFYWVPGRTAVGIPSGVGFLRGLKPTTGVTQNDLSMASIFFIVFGPDGVMRSGWPVQYVYARNAAMLRDGNVALDADRSANITGASRLNCLPANVFFNNANAACAPSVTCFAVYDWKRLLEETRNSTITGSGIVAMDAGATMVTNPSGLLIRLYGSPIAGTLARDDLLCRRTFLNPYTGLGIRETVTAVNPGGGTGPIGSATNPSYTDIDP